MPGKIDESINDKLHGVYKITINTKDYKHARIVRKNDQGVCYFDRSHLTEAIAHELRHTIHYQHNLDEEEDEMLIPEGYPHAHEKCVIEGLTDENDGYSCPLEIPENQISENLGYNKRVYHQVSHFSNDGNNPHERGKKGCSRLHVAAGCGVVSDLIKYLKMGGDPNIKDENGCAPLHYAASEGHLEAIKILLQYGADINALNRIGEPPLFMALRTNRLSTVEYLIKMNARLDITNIFGEAPIHIIATKPLWFFSKTMKLLSQVPTFNINQATHDGKTALHLCKNPLIAERLIKANANPELRDKQNRTPFQNAAIDDECLMIEFYIKKSPTPAVHLEELKSLSPKAYEKITLLSINS